jgi:dimethylglycine dehydrogenase
VREAAGMFEISGYAKYEITGHGAENWLSQMLANRMPEQGKLILTPMLNARGKLIGDFTLAKVDPERFYLFGSGAAEEYHLRYFHSHLRGGNGVAVKALGLGLTGLSVAGPRSREIVQRLTDTDLSTSAFPFLSFREIDIGRVPAKVGRITFTGDLGYEIWVASDYLLTLHDMITEAGRDLGLKPFGGRALLSLRLEKSWGIWAREYRPIYGPLEAGLSRFVDLRKNDFIGRDAALEERQRGGKLRLLTFRVDAPKVDVIGDEPVWHRGKVVGWITSGGYAHHAGKSVALGYVPKEVAGDDDGFEVEIIGTRFGVYPIREPLFDPTGAHMRA